jgi:hypothetical protein
MSKPATIIKPMKEARFLYEVAGLRVISTDALSWPSLVLGCCQVLPVLPVLVSAAQSN